LSPENKKRKIVLASVLKPVDDTRMTEKLTASLLATGLFEITIIGYPSVKPIIHTDVKIISLPPFKRFSWQRLIAPWLIFAKISRINPEVVIINTPELLLAGVLNRLFFKRKLVYDVLENYARNIRYTSAYPGYLRSLLAVVTRMFERCLTSFTDAIFLAEKGYAIELPFAKKAVVLENKLPRTIAKQYQSTNASRFNLVFTGTLATTTGIFDAIALCKSLHAIDNQYTLNIIGYCAQSDVLAEIHQQIKDYSYIRLTGGNRLVPHHEILQAIQLAGGGIIMYPPNPGTENSMPTKLYEYMACHLPILISHTPASTTLVETCRAGIALPTQVDYQALHERWQNATFDFQLPESIFWETEGKRLIDTLNNLK
jgi:glycosyltransferase involved in cell wall biosynthesis